jgi:hypothetical protein
MDLQLRIIATYDGIDPNGNTILHEVEIRGDRRTDIKKDHAWLNGAHANWPGKVPVGARVRFFASPLHRRGGARITDVRQLEVI